jgi:hypothetical protein
MHSRRRDPGTSDAANESPGSPGNSPAAPAWSSTMDDGAAGRSPGRRRVVAGPRRRLAQQGRSTCRQPGGASGASWRTWPQRSSRPPASCPSMPIDSSQLSITGSATAGCTPTPETCRRWTTCPSTGLRRLSPEVRCGLMAPTSTASDYSSAAPRTCRRDLLTHPLAPFLLPRRSSCIRPARAPKMSECVVRPSDSSIKRKAPPWLSRQPSPPTTPLWVTSAEPSAPRLITGIPRLLS